MKKEELVINEKNYQGYIRLYETYFWDIGVKELKKILKDGGITTVAIAATSLSPIPKLPVLGIDIALCAGFVSKSVYDFYKERRKKQKDIKKKYPYVDLKLSKEELEESLKKAKILEFDQYSYAKIKEKEYKNYVECEKVKKEYLNEVRHTYTTFLDPNNKEESPKVLQKLPKYSTKRYK